ncbi:MAG TPA: sortase [Ruminococcus sp.]|nr:sortase [Ruminococcus sp.]
MKNLSTVCILTGIALLLAALSLVLYNVHEDEQSGEQAQEILSVLHRDMDEIQALPQPTEETDYLKEYFPEYVEETEEALEEIAIRLDGSEYIGVIRISDIGIELPVMSEWSYPNLKIAPCRYRGSFQTGDLIIAGHNYRSHFGKIGDLSSGSEIIFTDVTGNEHHYYVMNIEQIAGTAVEKMEFGSGEEWDLTLFTCTLDGRSRVTVRALEVQNEE